MNEQKIKFRIYECSEHEDAEATIIDNEVVKIKLLGKWPKGYYYSALNHAGETFDELYPEFKLYQR